MRPKPIYVDGAACRHAYELEPGDRVDLENDKHADPEGWETGGRSTQNPSFHSEFEVVAKVEQETPQCVRVDFESGFSCGFPVMHLIGVDGEQET